MDSWKKLKRDTQLYLSRRLNKGWSPPDRVSLNLTLRCNLACTMCTTCYDSPELSLEEIKDIIDQTADWGVEVFNPLGGEPFMRPDLEEILRYAVSKGFYVTMTTNGTLISKGRAKMLADIPSDRLHFNISLDGNQFCNDAIRGEGNYQKALRGYQAIRTADQVAGNSKRKILVNSILHRQNLSTYMETLQEFQGIGFDGVQILNLFRAEDGTQTSDALWFQPSDFDALTALCQQLIAWKKTSPFIQNTEKELSQIPNYYRSGLSPLEAPCWAGWKELYINADGQAIMCDGELDFLNGAFGSVREQSLMELWQNPTVKARRSVVKQCKTPCVQTCYLRQDSDSGRQLLGRFLKQSYAQVDHRILSKFQRWQPIDAKIVLEFADVSPSDWEGSQTPHARWRDLIRNCPEIPRRENWTTFRDKGHVDFGRGFMGFAELRRVMASLESARLQFAWVAVGWRGEPLLHPEIEPMLKHLVHGVNLGVFKGLEIHTSGQFLREEIAQTASLPIPQRWIIDLDVGDRMGVEMLQRYQGASTQIVLKQQVVEGTQSLMWANFFNLPIWIGDAPPMPSLSEGNIERVDYFWFAHHNADNFFVDTQNLACLERLATEHALPLHYQRRKHCSAPMSQLVISWDAKVTLCSRDIQLQNTVGDANHVEISDIWQSLDLLQGQCASVGRPQREFCRDCGMFEMPRHSF